MKRFNDKVTKVESGCHLWNASLKPNGYGQFKFEGTMVLAHRFAYELEVGPIPEGLHIDHLCQVKACVNVLHLEPVTPQENTRRAAGDHCLYGHPRTDENTQMVRGDNGQPRPRCKPCANRYSRDSYHGLKKVG